MDDNKTPAHRLEKSREVQIAGREPLGIKIKIKIPPSPS